MYRTSNRLHGSRPLCIAYPPPGRNGRHPDLRRRPFRKGGTGKLDPTKKTFVNLKTQGKHTCNFKIVLEIVLFGTLLCAKNRAFWCSPSCQK